LNCIDGCGGVMFDSVAAFWGCYAAAAATGLQSGKPRLQPAGIIQCFCSSGLFSFL